MAKRKPVNKEQLQNMFKAMGVDPATTDKEQVGTVKVTYRWGVYGLEIVDIQMSPEAGKEGDKNA